MEQSVCWVAVIDCVVSSTVECQRDSQVTWAEEKKAASPAATGSQQLGGRLQVSAVQVALFHY